jgi:hypothetical protein
VVPFMGIRLSWFHGGVLFIGVAGLVSILAMAAIWIASKKRRAAIRRYDLERIQASAQLPDLSHVSTVDAVLILQWRIDFETHYKVHTSLLIGRARLIPFVILGAVGAGIVSVNSHLSQRHGHHIQIPFLQILPYIGMMFGAIIVEVVVILAATRAAARRSMRKQYTDVPIQHYGLILNTDGLRVVSGNIVSEVPWKRVNFVQEFQDNVWLVSRVSQQALPIIPSSAFHSAGDGKAFAATVRALKRRKQRPAHNWSGYGVNVPAVEGVWPPAVR